MFPARWSRILRQVRKRAALGAARPGSQGTCYQRVCRCTEAHSRHISRPPRHQTRLFLFSRDYGTHRGNHQQLASRGAPPPGRRAQAASTAPASWSFPRPRRRPLACDPTLPRLPQALMPPRRGTTTRGTVAQTMQRETARSHRVLLQHRERPPVGVNSNILLAQLCGKRLDNSPQGGSRGHRNEQRWDYAGCNRLLECEAGARATAALPKRCFANAPLPTRKLAAQSQCTRSPPETAPRRVSTRSRDTSASQHAGHSETLCATSRPGSALLKQRTCGQRHRQLSPSRLRWPSRCSPSLPTACARRTRQACAAQHPP